MHDINTTYLLCAVVPTLVLLWKWRTSRTRPPLPPGPKGLPLLGNLRDIPRDVPTWQTFTSMARNNNADVLYLRLLTEDFVVLNTSKAISDLSEKRSTIYCDRPRKPMLDLMGIQSWVITFMRYGSEWRSIRRLAHEFLNTKVVAGFDDYQRKHSNRLLLNLIESPDNFFDHAEFAVAGLIMEMTYSMNIKSSEDRFLRAIVEASLVARRALVPGAFLVDILPILKYVPEWFPGAGFKALAKEARVKSDMAVDGPLEHVKEVMKSGGSNKVSIAWSCYDRMQESTTHGLTEEIIRAATGTMYAAAVGNTTSLLQLAVLVMGLYPHILKKAQEELDTVVGSERLPELSDKEDLPYISAILKELLRWGCPTPIGVPKRVMEDDIYDGYFIPGGATVIENVWAVFHDESIYPASYTYDPERFLRDEKLDRSVMDPEERIFGSGRRICLGRHFATRTIFLNIARIFAVFDIEAPAGEKLEAKFYEKGFVRYPTPFKCKITPRSEASLKLIQSLCEAEDD